MRPRLGVFPRVAVGLTLWVGCSASSAADRASSDDPGDSDGTKASGGASSGGVTTPPGGGRGPGGDPLPPETETEPNYTLPVRSGRWVWSANPESGKVAVVDTSTLGVQLTRGGFAPSFLAPLGVAGAVESAAIVANAKSNDATVMRRIGDDVTSSTVPTHVGVNAWAVSASSRFAIAWSNSALLPTADPSDGFQDITVVDTAQTPPASTRLSVGYRPSRIFFQDDETRAFIVSSAGITIVELDGQAPAISRDVSLSELPTETPTDVSVLPSGTHALFRVEGSPRVSLVEIANGKRSDVLLSGPVTDLDLVANGTNAIAVVRGQRVGSGGSNGQGGRPGTGGAGMAGAGGVNAGGADAAAGGDAGGNAGGSESAGAGGAAGTSAGGSDTAGAGGSGVSGSGGANANLELAELSAAGWAGAAGAAGSPELPPTSGFGPSQVALLDVLTVARDPAEFESVFLRDLVGSVAVSEAGTMAVLYTTATGLDRLTVLNTDPAAAEYLEATTAKVHAPVDAVFIAPDTEHALVSLRVAAGSTIGGAFGVVPLANPGLTTIKTTDAPINAVAFAPSPSTSAILTSAKGHTAYLVHMPSRRVDAVPLPSLPLASGIVPGETGYVVQKHPEGRLSLIDLDTAETRTLTGFELAGGINDGK